MFYNHSKGEREKITQEISHEIRRDFFSGSRKGIVKYFGDDDTYIRKAAYISVGKIYLSVNDLRGKIIVAFSELMRNENPKIRQTTINAAGEIGKKDFECVVHFFETGLSDGHHSVRNAVIGCIKKTGEKNPVPVLRWAKKFLLHPDNEIRREICHGLELRGRKYPLDVLPLLKELQNEKNGRVRNTLIHVLGQISYKKGCLENVVSELNGWENRELCNDAVNEIIDVHCRYRHFSFLTPVQAFDYIKNNFFGFVPRTVPQHEIIK